MCRRTAFGGSRGIYLPWHSFLSSLPNPGINLHRKRIAQKQFSHNQENCLKTDEKIHTNSDKIYLTDSRTVWYSNYKDNLTDSRNPAVGKPVPKTGKLIMGGKGRADGGIGGNSDLRGFFL